MSNCDNGMGKTVWLKDYFDQYTWSRLWGQKVHNNITIDMKFGHVVVTGACGFLGSHIIRMIRERTTDTIISGLDVNAAAVSSANSEHSMDKAEQSVLSLQYYVCDVASIDAVRELFNELNRERGQVTVVIHTASPQLTASDAVLRRVNIEGARSIVQICQEANVHALVYTSSASVVMNHSMTLVNANESWPVQVDADQPEYYATTKAYAERIVLNANRKQNYLLTCALRPSGMFGEGDTQMLPRMIETSRRGKSRFLIGSDDNLFDFTYVGNVAHAHLLAATALLQTYKLRPTIPLDMERVDGEAFFITNNQPMFFWDFVRAVWRELGDYEAYAHMWKIPACWLSACIGVSEFFLGLTGKRPKLTRKQIRFASLTRFYCITKARQRLAYEPIVSLDEAIKRSVRWFVEREATEDIGKT